MINAKLQLIKTIHLIGEFKISTEEIELNNEFISIKELKNLTLRYSSEPGEDLNSFLSFNYYGKEHKLLFNINESQIQKMKDLLSDWYANGINFNEYDYFKTRSFLLNSDLSYRQIQDIKEKYKIKGHWI